MLPGQSAQSVIHCCVLIPVYNHEHAVGAVVQAVLAHGLPCLLIDDGSSPACAQVLRNLQAAEPGRITLLVHPINQGKGGAMLSGFQEAARLGYSHALQIDADGQHTTSDIPAFIEAAKLQPDAVIVGYPIYDASVPKARLYGRYATHIWVWINTLSLQIRDSMCGFRVYPLAPVLALMARQPLGRRMNFDTDILVRLVWDQVPVQNLGTRVGYPSDGVSHFRLWHDNLLITRMHSTLFFGMLLRLPRLLAGKFSRPPSRIKP